MATIIMSDGRDEYDVPEEKVAEYESAHGWKVVPPATPALGASHTPAGPNTIHMTDGRDDYDVPEHKVKEYESTHGWKVVAPAGPPPEISKAQSAAAGAVQGATLGFGDEASAVIEAAFPKFSSIGSEAGVIATGDTFGDRYKNARDWYRNRNKKASDANPKTYFAGELGGGLLLPGGAITKGVKGAAPALSAARLAAAEGMLLGGIGGIGTSEADDALGIAQDAAWGATGGAVVGGGFAKLAEKFPALARNLSQKFSKKADAAQSDARRHALKAGATGSAKSVTQNLDAEQDGLAQEIGQTMLDKLSLRKKPSEMAEEVNRLLGQTGKELEGAVAQVGPEHFPNIKAVFGDSSAEVLAGLRNHNFGGDAAEKLEKYLREAAEKGVDRRVVEKEIAKLIGNVLDNHPNLGADVAETAAAPIPTWAEFLKQRMGPAMKEHGSHGAAVKKLGEEYAALKAGAPPTQGPSLGKRLEEVRNTLLDPLNQMKGPKAKAASHSKYLDMVKGDEIDADLAERLRLIGENWSPVDEMTAGHVRGGAKAGPVFDANDTVFEISPKLYNALMKDGQEVSSVAPELAKSINKLNTTEKVSAKALWKLRQDVDDVIYGIEGDKNPARHPALQQLREYRNKISELIGDAIGKATDDPNLWADKNKLYSHLKRLQGDVLPKGIGSEQNLKLGLRETGASTLGSSLGGGLGYLVGGPQGAAAGVVAGGPAGALVSHLAKRYGPAFLARNSEARAKLLREAAKDPLARLRRGGEAATAVEQYLIRKYLQQEDE